MLRNYSDLFKKIDENWMEGMEGLRLDNSTTVLKDICKNWITNKQELFELLNHNLQYCLGVVDLDYSLVQNNYLDNDNQRKEKFFKKILEKYWDKLSIREIQKIKNFNLDLTTEEFFSNELRIPRYDYCAGTKVSKCFKKIIEKDNADCLNSIQIDYSKITQYRKDKGKNVLMLSIHPYDYLTISDNNHDWTSCHSSYDGDYRLGNFEYLGDEVTIVAYLINKDDINNGFKFNRYVQWNSKKWRSLIRAKKVNGKWTFIIEKQYPYTNDNITDFLVTKLQLLTKSNLTAVKTDNFTTQQREKLYRHAENANGSLYYSDFYQGAGSIFVAPTEDIKIDNDEAMLDEDFLKSLIYSPFEVGQPILCFKCGQHIACDSDGNIEGLCEDCYQQSYASCLNCCERINLEEDEYYHIYKSDEYICRWCAEDSSLGMILPDEDVFVHYTDMSYNGKEFNIEDDNASDLTIGINLSKSYRLSEFLIFPKETKTSEAIKDVDIVLSTVMRPVHDFSVQASIKFKEINEVCENRDIPHIEMPNCWVEKDLYWNLKDFKFITEADHITFKLIGVCLEEQFDNLINEIQKVADNIDIDTTNITLV